MKVVDIFCCYIVLLEMENTKVNSKELNTHFSKWVENVETNNYSLIMNMNQIENFIAGMVEWKNVTFGVKTTWELRKGGLEIRFNYMKDSHFTILLYNKKLGSKKLLWRTIAYDKGQWAMRLSIENPLSAIPGPILFPDKIYQLWLCFINKRLKIYINDTLLYNDSENINDEMNSRIDVEIYHNTLQNISIKNAIVDRNTGHTLIKIRNAWRSDLVGNQTLKGTHKDAIVKSFVDKLSTIAVKLYDEMNKSPDRQILWGRFVSSLNIDLVIHFSNLYIIARAYGTKGTTLYKKPNVLKDIVSGLDFMTRRQLYGGVTFFGNWYKWQIGIPKRFIPILIIIRNEINPNKLKKYVDIISEYLPNPYQQLLTLNARSNFKQATIFSQNNFTTGANRVDTSLCVLELGLLSDNPKKILTAIEGIRGILDTVDHGAGFHRDFSFIQHDNTPANGSYGLVLLEGLCQILSMIAGTVWDVKSDFKKRLIDIVKKSYVPFIVNLQLMPMVSGRSITRTYYSQGTCILFDLIHASEFANKKDKQFLQQAAKYWISRSNSKNLLRKVRNFKDLMAWKAIMLNQDIDNGTKPFVGSRFYENIDRFIYSDHKITLGISLYSKRVLPFDNLSRENKKGWHTSDGMIYLYNNDQQFGVTYWPTVDWKRLPGTTIDTRPIPNAINITTLKSLEDFVGGVNNENFAVVAMQLSKRNKQNYIGHYVGVDLEAKKSWYILNGKIICLGADITGTTDYSIETIIENRLLNPNTRYALVNNKGQKVENKRLELEEYDWLILNPYNGSQATGYIMLQKQNVTTIRENRIGTYKDINDAYPTHVTYNESYQKIIINHGKDVTRDTYAYLIYPNAKASFLTTFQSYNQIVILTNNENVQAVRDFETNTLGATVWKTDGASVEEIIISKPATLLIRRLSNDRGVLHISNPKQNNAIIELDFPHLIDDVFCQDQGVEPIRKNGIVINTTGAFGKTFKIEYRIPKELR